MGKNYLARHVGLTQYYLEKAMAEHANNYPEIAQRLGLPLHKNPRPVTGVNSPKKELVISEYVKNPNPDTIKRLTKEYGLSKETVIGFILNARTFSTAADRTRAITEIKYGRH